MGEAVIGLIPGNGEGNWLGLIQARSIVRLILVVMTPRWCAIADPEQPIPTLHQNAITARVRFSYY